MAGKPIPKTESLVDGVKVILQADTQDDGDMFSGIDHTVHQLLFNPNTIERFRDYSRESWFETVLVMHGRAALGLSFWIICSEACLVCLIFHYLVPDVLEELPATPFGLVGSGLMFLSVFRTQTSYKKWQDSRLAWSKVGSHCRDLAMQCCMYIKHKPIATEACRLLIVYVIALRCWLRCEDADPKQFEHLLSSDTISRIMQNYQAGDHDIAPDPNSHLYPAYLAKKSAFNFQFRNVCAPLVCLELLRESFTKAQALKAMGPFHMSLEGNVKGLLSSQGTFERQLNTQIPFAYISHLHTMLLIYLMSLPFFLVKSLGWVMPPSIAFLAYVIIGLENVSAEIENPFGYDANDLPMDQYCAEICRDIRDINRRCREHSRKLQQAGHPEWYEEDQPESQGEAYKSYK